MKQLALAAAISFALLLVACDRQEAPADSAAPAPVAADVAEPESEVVPVVERAPTGVPAVAAASDVSLAGAEAPLVAGDLDAYVAGMTREIEILTGHADALATARAANDQTGELAALAALGAVDVRNAGAQAAGLEVARYATIKTRIDDVLSALEMGAAMKPQLKAAESADLSGFTDTQKQQHAEGLAQMRAAWGAPHERLPAEVVEPFKAREAELAKLRADAIALRLGALKG